VLGGAAVPRTIDAVDVVRVPSIRGQLRFWWRALNAQGFSSANELYQAESELFGRAADENRGRSPVEIRLHLRATGKTVEEDIQPGKTPGDYALFPARRENKGKPDEVPPAPRRKPGTRFTLELRAPKERLEELRPVLRAWILFGGYGSRTRRGLGSLTVTGADRASWLPKEATREALAALFGRDLFAPQVVPAELAQTPRLAGASLLVVPVSQQAEGAWLTALNWLRDFRQGTNTGARQEGKGKPSVSNWPEANNIRRLIPSTWTHRPNPSVVTVTWPRAGFGLPIGVKFLGEGPKQDGESKKLEITWKDGEGLHNRLASPLIVKAMPLANGEFVPIALWLERAWPPNGEVVLRKNKTEDVPKSAAGFDKLLGENDRALFPPLRGKATLRAAFLDWLASEKKATRIAG
jgi:CRISPR-associated protein Cmr1